MPVNAGSRHESASRRLMIGGAGLRAALTPRSAISARSQGVDPGVCRSAVRFAVRIASLPQRLAAQRQTASPHVTRMGDPGFCSSPSFTQAAACSQWAKAVTRSNWGNLGFCAASARNSERHLLMPAAFGDDVRSGRRTRTYAGEFFSGPHRFDVPMQEAAIMWLPRHLRALGAAEIACLSDFRRQRDEFSPTVSGIEDKIETRSSFVHGRSPASVKAGEFKPRRGIVRNQVPASGI